MSHALSLPPPTVVFSAKRWGFTISRERFNSRRWFIGFLISQSPLCVFCLAFRLPNSDRGGKPMNHCCCIYISNLVVDSAFGGCCVAVMVTVRRRRDHLLVGC